MPVSAQAATIIIDGDTIDIDGVRIRIVQIDTTETFGPCCENELILGLKAKPIASDKRPAAETTAAAAPGETLALPAPAE